MEDRGVQVWPLGFGTILPVDHQYLDYLAANGAQTSCDNRSVSKPRAMVVQDRAEMILIVAKALDLTWQTTKAILLLRGGARGVSSHDLDQCLASFTRLKPATARQVLQFQRLRAKA